MEEKVSHLLDAGRRISNDDYVACHRRHVLKTFYFLCRRLNQSAAGSRLSCHTLNEYLRRQLANSGHYLPPEADPVGWFGYLWTVAADGGAPEYPAIIPQVLDRSAQRPYLYWLRGEEYTAVFDYFKNGGSCRHESQARRTPVPPANDQGRNMPD